MIRVAMSDAHEANGGLAVAEGSGFARDVSSLWKRVVGTDIIESVGIDSEQRATDDLEYVPLVLVVGATGRTGRIIVRKLVLQGFRVAVLVRSLSTDTLNLLGSGVSYSYGDMTDYRSLLDAMEDVDKVVFAAEAADPSAETKGLNEVIRAFHDTRNFMYGNAEATKLNIFKFRKDEDFERWSIESSMDEISQRLASAGLLPQPSIAYWKRSPTESHKHGVFVGKVFDSFLGTATATCDLRGKTLSFVDESKPPVPEDAPLDLGDHSGLMVRAKGDGKVYTVVLRTDTYESQGIEYHADFPTSEKGFTTARLPFSSFTPFKNGRSVSPDASPGALDRHKLLSMGFSFRPQLNGPDGSFYLSVVHIKTYRKRDEPEFVYISDSEVRGDALALPAAAGAIATGAHTPAAVLPRELVKRRGEEILRSSGLTYFILRPSELDDRKGGKRRIAFRQGDPPVGSTVSRTDVAEVVVRSLLDPRACNVACSVSESPVVAKESEALEQDISKMLEVMMPNKI